MLVNFRVENFKSFKDLTEFSMEATKLKNLKDSNTFEINNISLLKSAVIYGANASGKSNLLKAMSRMRQIILNSSNLQHMKEYSHESFLLNSNTDSFSCFALRISTSLDLNPAVGMERFQLKNESFSIFAMTCRYTSIERDKNYVAVAIESRKNDADLILKLRIAMRN